MMNKSNQFIVLAAVVLPLLFAGCAKPGVNSPGSEYMPDMAHSIANEANVYTYYYPNTWDDASVVKLKDISMPRKPVSGTIPRGYAGVHYASNATARNAVMSDLHGETSIQSIPVPINGSVPYYYEDSDTGRILATNELIDNPFPITNEGLVRGKELYNVFCGVCHGEKGDGNGYLVDEKNPNAVYPAAPANFLSDVFVPASNGRYYHAIIYGKNVMGGYTDKLSYEERWQVIHHIRSLQASSTSTIYNEEINTLNNIDVPASLAVNIAMKSNEEGADVEGHGHGAGHSEGAGNGEGHGDNHSTDDSGHSEGDHSNGGH